MISNPKTAYLIVNADDYGYFNCVSRGILEAARNGIVKATGVFANSSLLNEHVSWLQEYTTLDTGIHLNLTEGKPLSAIMRRVVNHWDGRFPQKFTMVKAIIFGVVKPEDVTTEWRMQIEKCLNSGLKLAFVNSHEHIHMLPILFPVVQALSKEYSIPHIRLTGSELLEARNKEALLRNTMLMTMGFLNRLRLKNPSAYFLGMGQSGRLNLPYVNKCLRKLKSGQVYELMCHPGYFDPNEIAEPQLLNYHDWEGELSTLTDPSIKELCNNLNIKLIGYKDVEIKKGKLVVETDNTDS